MSPARNDTGHCQKDKGRVELPSVSGLIRGRCRIQIFISASCTGVSTLSQPNTQRRYIQDEGVYDVCWNKTGMHKRSLLAGECSLPQCTIPDPTTPIAYYLLPTKGFTRCAVESLRDATAPLHLQTKIGLSVFTVPSSN